MCLVTQLCPTLCKLLPARLLCPWGFARQEYWNGKLFLYPRDHPSSGFKPRSSTLQADSLPSEPPGKPMNTGMDSLSLLQGIFPTQESNQGPLHCRQILYQLSCQLSSPGRGVWSMWSSGQKANDLESWSCGTQT